MFGPSTGALIEDSTPALVQVQDTVAGTWESLDGVSITADGPDVRVFAVVATSEFGARLSAGLGARYRVHITHGLGESLVPEMFVGQVKGWRPAGDGRLSVTVWRS